MSAGSGSEVVVKVNPLKHLVEWQIRGKKAAEAVLPSFMRSQSLFYMFSFNNHNDLV